MQSQVKVTVRVTQTVTQYISG